MRQANRVANHGKNVAAEKLYREAVEEFPNLTPAWLGLARVVGSDEERQQLISHVLTLEPKNEIAQAAFEGGDLNALLNPPEPKAEVASEAATDIVQVDADNHTHSFEEEDEVVGLRCNKCGKPIDIKTAQHTAVGYRCADCLREIESTYFTATTANVAAGLGVAVPLAIIAAVLISVILGGIGFFSWMITIFISPAVGTFIGSLAFRAAGRNRSRRMPMLMSVVMWGAAILAIPLLWTLGYAPNFIVLAIFAFSASGAAYFRVK